MMTQLVLHASISNHSRLIMKRVITVVYIQNHTERINIMFGKNPEFIMLN
jgi:hypothetical protein